MLLRIQLKQRQQRFGCARQHEQPRFLAAGIHGPPFTRKEISIVRFWVPLLYLAVPLLLWQTLVWFGQVPRPLLASPVEALTSLTTRWAVIAPHAAASFRLVALALPLALVLAYILACCMWLSGAARAVIMPALVVLVALPVFVLGRVLSFWFGLDGIAVKVTILVLILTFPVTLALTLGMEHLPRETLDAAAIDGASLRQRLWYILLPLARPATSAGMLAAAAIAPLALFAAEQVGTAKGLGFFVLQSLARSKPDDAMAAVLLLSALGLSLFALAALLRYLWMPWEFVSRS